MWCVCEELFFNEKQLLDDEFWMCVVWVWGEIINGCEEQLSRN
jgi:hypothetical protein